MSVTDLDRSHCKLLGALTLAALKHLAGDTLVFDADNDVCTGWRVARVGDIALVENPADQQSTKRIDCYWVTERSISGAVFKLDPVRLVYSLQWRHNAQPPDFDLVLLKAEPRLWVNGVNLIMLSELRRRAPDSIDWLQDDVMPKLDAFEATRGAN